MNLIHVTKFKNIENIIREGLKCSLSKEEFTYVDGTENAQYVRRFFIPMVCFFGMDIKEHLSFKQSYGDLGIIFKDNIKFNNNVNPVRYYNIYSDLLKRTIEIPKEGKHVFVSTLKGASTVGFNSAVAKFWRDSLIFSKPFTAHLYRRCVKCKDYYLAKKEYNFGLEREWRVIPKTFFNENFYDSESKEIMESKNFDSIIKIKNHVKGFIVKNKSKKKELLFILNKYGFKCTKIYVKKNYGWKSDSKQNHTCNLF